MKLLVGLGNPGDRYRNNRHNIGFMVLDEIARYARAPSWKKKFEGQATEAVLDGVRALLLKPETFMNDSGRSVAAAMRFHKIPLADVTVFHDELDLPPARMRAKIGGGNAGHNGLRSITALCGNDYARVRLGIGHPGDKALVHSYVLSDFAKSEGPWVQDICRLVADEVPRLISGDAAGFQSRVLAAMAAAGHHGSGPGET
jgi:PTH1 family peptidyl-tRNA hydrolase